MKYYIIRDGAATSYDTWDDAARDYLARPGGVIAEAVPVTIALVPTRISVPQQSTSRAAIAREHLLDGEAPMLVCERTGLSRQAVYDIRKRLVRDGLLTPLQRGRKATR